MIILGLDPGTAIVGWGVIDTGPKHQIDKAVCLGYNCIITDKNLSDARRLVAIASGLEKVLKEYTPDLVSIERLFFARNQTTIMTVSQARGVLLLISEQQGVPIVEFTPLQVKQALTGYGKAEKSQMQLMTKMLLRLSDIPKPDDAADALALAITAGQQSGLLQLRQK